ncbi:MAG: hypothetical protein COW19_10845 [Zetaproteobacteria bacterium CG12_big_fil_rev_8_21_14_0_65_55_1124]|nr:MAG: hypothetical protein AUJ58_02050 [Zetaproteobacteria bacterium CG1_02_55_237]PIS18967.1 MAG: hypothetical protein COT53_07880 [Zetaproteobacteria bacterium CG08_land_8_20_14_0_20_55_17]PIW41890.1 MAG: hypothetical protein COW19_10845 [Zetaproteobacteria bacterium CG12_big_fil_rev_8_21_14_0_65_55_1124]PIY53506.1 MAG: hypothetical protein COZ01_03390 [Zetaproteobacteria bacterium CG_4_10_14_0_8_um_filter_55_43]PIZ37375.1 MAG: hypothetical protein COY36_09235 [Zetaproteobacteria bacterium 
MIDIGLSWPAAVGILFFLLLASAFFSGAETALTRARRFRLRMLGEEGNQGARRAEKLLEHPERMLSGILLGNNFVNIAASSLTTVIFVSYFGENGIVYATLAMTMVVVLLAEILPKTIAVAHAEPIACRVAGILQLIVNIFSPLITMLMWMIHIMQRMLKVPQNTDRKIITHQELSTIIDVGAEAGVLDAAREQMLMNSLHLHNVPIKALMTPRKDVYWLDATHSTADCLQEAMNRPHSRYPVYHGKHDHIVGIVHLRDLVKYRHRKGPMLDVMIWRDVPYAPANKNALQQLFDFQNHRQHMAIVVDEYGDIDGLISMEDILEEIVGEIEDESDMPAVPEMWPQPDGSVVAAGTVSLHDINQEMDLELPEEGATTLGGLIIERIGAQPEAAMCLVVAGVRLEISELEGNSIRRVRISESEQDVAPEK